MQWSGRTCSSVREQLAGVTREQVSQRGAHQQDEVEEASAEVVRRHRLRAQLVPIVRDLAVSPDQRPVVRCLFFCCFCLVFRVLGLILKQGHYTSIWLLTVTTWRHVIVTLFSSCVAVAGVAYCQREFLQVISVCFFAVNMRRARSSCRRERVASASCCEEPSVRSIKHPIIVLHPSPTLRQPRHASGVCKYCQ